jgi:hypothetical protein
VKAQSLETTGQALGNGENPQAFKYYRENAAVCLYPICVSLSLSLSLSLSVSLSVSKNLIAETLSTDPA